jgi:hypothetical protein
MAYDCQDYGASHDSDAERARRDLETAMIGSIISTAPALVSLDGETYPVRLPAGAQVGETVTVLLADDGLLIAM